MNQMKPHGMFDRQQKDQTETRRANREVLLGQKVLNPQEIIPKYLNNEEVKKMESDLLALAQDSNRVPTPREMKVFTNFIGVRFCVMRGKRIELIKNLTREEYLQAQRSGLRMYRMRETEDGRGNHWNSDSAAYELGGDIGHIRLETASVDSGERPSALEGVMVKIKKHKTAPQKGPAVIFLSLPDCVLMDAYDYIACRYRKSLPPTDADELDNTFLINTKGDEIKDFDFGLFSRITGYTDFTSHLARRMYTTWMTHQNNMQLQEFAAFAASHGTEVQKANYLGRQSQRLAAICADTVYYSAITGAQNGASGQSGQRVQITEEYDEQRAREMTSMDRRKWNKAVERERKNDLQKLPEPERVITPDVGVNLLGLIVAHGVPGTLDKLLNPKPSVKILDFFLRNTSKIQNQTGKSLILAMIDFAPELEQSKILLENLLVYCRMRQSGVQLNQIEKDWTEKLIEYLRRFNKNPNTDRSEDIDASRHKLSIRLKDILLPLNRDCDFQYCFGNYRHEDALKDLAKEEFYKTQSIKRLTDKGSAISVKEAIKQVKKRAQEMQQEEEQRMEKLDADAVSRQNAPPPQETPASVSKERDQSTSQQSELSEEQADNSDEMYDDGPSGAPQLRTVTHVRAQGGKRLRITGSKGMSFEFDTQEDLLITDITPHKKLRLAESTKTPDRLTDPKTGKEMRSKPLTNKEKIEVLELYIEYAQKPFETKKQGEMKADCELIWDKQRISRGQLKGTVWKNSENMCDLLIGKGGAGLKAYGNIPPFPNAGKGLTCYIREGMIRNFPGVDATDWTDKQLRSIKDDIIEHAKRDVQLTESESDDE